MQTTFFYNLEVIAYDLGWKKKKQCLWISIDKIRHEHGASSQKDTVQLMSI